MRFCRFAEFCLVICWISLLIEVTCAFSEVVCAPIEPLPLPLLVPPIASLVMLVSEV